MCAHLNGNHVNDDVSSTNKYGGNHNHTITQSHHPRFPAYKSLICAILGNGSQFLTLFTGLMMMAFAGLFNVHHHGSFNTAVVMLYAFTCFISGYVSNRLYKSIDGLNWVWNIVLTSSVFAVPFFLCWSTVNSVAWYQGSTHAREKKNIYIYSKT